MAALSNTKHELFAQKTVELDNKSEAYRIAYPKYAERWSDKSIWEAASKLSNDPKVKPRIQAIRDSLANKLMITKEEMVKTLKTISEVSITDYYRPRTTAKTEYDKNDKNDFEMIPITEWSKAMGRACTKIKPVMGGFELTIHGTEYPYKELNKMLGHYAPKEVKVESDSIASLLGDILDD